MCILLSPNSPPENLSKAMVALTPSHTTITSHSSTSPGQSSDKPPNPILNHSPTPWTTDKDKKLLKCVADEKSFEDLAAELGNRSVDDCLKRWDEHLRSRVDGLVAWNLRGLGC